MLSTMSSLGWVSDAYTFSSVATFVAPRRVLTYPLYAGAPLGTCLAPGALRRYAGPRVVLAAVVAIDAADASSSRRSKSGRSRAAPSPPSRAGAGTAGEFGHAVRVGLDPREHVVAPELELLRDVRDGHLPSATRERALENLDLRGGELGREGFRSANIFSQSSSAARGATERRLGASTSDAPPPNPGTTSRPAEPRGTGCASDERRAGPGRTRGRGARDDERGYLLSERDHRGLTGRRVE